MGALVILERFATWIHIPYTEWGTSGVVPIRQFAFLMDEFSSEYSECGSLLMKQAHDITEVWKLSTCYEVRFFFCR